MIPIMMPLWSILPDILPPLLPKGILSQLGQKEKKVLLYYCQTVRKIVNYLQSKKTTKSQRITTVTRTVITITQEGGKPQMQRERFLTTGDSASNCEVTSTAVLKWLGAGRQPVFTIPGGHYRILKTDFRAFLEEYSMFVDEGFFGKGRKRILIVDDEPAVVAFIESALRLGSDYELVTASDGFEAGRQVTAFRPDLIVLDLMLPGVNGFEICRRVKTDPATQHVRILVVTGFASDENIQKALQYGADDYLEKPLKLEDLREKVHGLLRTES
jgi:CheY-like chemotaxis protein